MAKKSVKIAVGCLEVWLRGVVHTTKVAAVTILFRNLLFLE